MTPTHLPRNPHSPPGSTIKLLGGAKVSHCLFPQIPTKQTNVRRRLPIPMPPPERIEVKRELQASKNPNLLCLNIAPHLHCRPLAAELLSMYFVRFLPVSCIDQHRFLSLACECLFRPACPAAWPQLFYYRFWKACFCVCRLSLPFSRRSIDAIKRAERHILAVAV